MGRILLENTNEQISRRIGLETTIGSLAATKHYVFEAIGFSFNGCEAKSRVLGYLPAKYLPSKNPKATSFCSKTFGRQTTRFICGLKRMSNSNNQVVLHRYGDSRPVVIGTSKCLIRSMIDSEQVDCCAIFSGPSGTVIRSYVSDVLVNGTPASVRSLSVGDEIELPCKNKFEVHASVEMQSVISSLHTDEEEPGNNSEGPTVTTQNPSEETLLSPFSEDLPAIVAQANVAGSAAGGDAKQVVGIDQRDIDSMFSGITTQSAEGSGAAVTPAPQIPVVVAQPAAIDQPNSQDHQAAPALEADEDIGEFADIQSHLQSLMSGAIPPEPPQPASSVTTAGVVGTVASAAAANVAANVLGATPAQPAAPEAELDQPFTAPPNLQAIEEVQPMPQVQPTVSVELVPEALQAPPAMQVPPVVQVPPAIQTPPVAEVQQYQAVKPPVSTAAPDSPAAQPESTVATHGKSDPLSELPDDLRNQLDDLMSSLENQTSQTDDNAASATADATPVDAFGTPAQAQPETFEATEALEVEVEVEVEQPRQQPPQDNRSVAEILGAMGMDVPGSEEVGFANNVGSNVADQPLETAPETPAQPIQNTPATPVFSSPQQDAEQFDGEESDEDIQAYMDRLLNRAPKGPSESPAFVAPPSMQSEPEPVQAEPVVPLSPEEFVPTHKASRPANYDTLREIANSSSRAAIQQSTSRTKTSSGQIFLFGLILSVIGVIATFCLSLHYIGVMFVIVAAICLALYLFAGKSQSKAVLEAMQKVRQK